MSKQSAVQLMNAAESRNAAVESNCLLRQRTLGPHLCAQREAVVREVEEDAPSLVREVINSPGRPLDLDTRNFMEPRFGYDFSRVRVHTDDRAAESTQAVHANAYTAGNHIAFGAGRYSPGSSDGRLLMAHELTHVVQQSSGPVVGTTVVKNLSVSDPSDAFEQRASTFARVAADPNFRRPAPSSFITPGTVSATGAGISGATLQRQTPPTPPTPPTPSQPNAALADVGAAFGIAGAVFGAASLALAAVAYFRPPEALNPMPTTGGVSISPNPFSFNTLNTFKPVKEPKRNRQVFLQAQRSKPKRHKILNLKTDGDNEAVLYLATRSDGFNILDASAQLGETRGYRGGSRASNASISLSPTPLYLAAEDEKALFGEPEEIAAPKEAPTKSAGAKAGSSKKENAPTMEAEKAEPSPQPAEVMITITGTNTPDPKPAQAFSADVVVKADNSVKCTRCETTNALGSARPNGETAEVDYRAGQLTPIPEGEGPGDFGPERPFKPQKNVPV